MFVSFPINDDAAVENAGVLVELPAHEVVSSSGILGAADPAFNEGCTTAAEIVMKRVCKPDGFVFVKFPTGVIPADIISHVPREEAVLLALDFLLESFAVVGELGLFVSICHCAKDQRSKARKCDAHFKEKHYQLRNGANKLSSFVKGVELARRVLTSSFQQQSAKLATTVSIPLFRNLRLGGVMVRPIETTVPAKGPEVVRLDGVG